MNQSFFKNILVNSLFLAVICFVLVDVGYAQNGSVGVGTRTPDPSAILDVFSSSKGLLLPRIHIVDTSIANPVVSPADGLLVFNNTYNPGDKTSGTGIYYWSTSLNRWSFILSSNAVQNIDPNLIYKTIKTKSDSLTSDSYIGVINGDSAMLNRVKLALNLKNVSDSLLKQNYFRDSVSLLVINSNILKDSIVSFVRNTTTNWYNNNTTLNDSIFNTVLSKSDSLAAKNHITINGKSKMDSVVLRAVVLDLDILGLAKDSVFSKALAADSVFMNTFSKDMVLFRNLSGMADSLTTKNHIMVNDVTGSDSTVFKKVSLGLDLAGLAKDTGFSHLLARDSSFVTTLAKDSVFNKTLAAESVFINTVSKDTVLFRNLSGMADSLTTKNHIMVNDVTGSDSTVFKKVSLGLDLAGLAKDTGFSHLLARDSSFVTTLAKDSVFNKTLAADSVFINTVSKDTVLFRNLSGMADSLTTKNHIMVNDVTGSDSIVFKKASLSLDLAGLAKDTSFNQVLTRDSSFVTTLAKDSVIADSVRYAPRQFYSNIRTVSINTTILPTDYTIIIRKITGNVTISLPAPETCKGRILIFSYLLSTTSPTSFNVLFDRNIWYGDDYKSKMIESGSGSYLGGNYKIIIQSTGLPETDSNGGWIVISSAL